MVQMLAEQNNPTGQLMLGVAYYEGTGVEKDLKQAKKWLEKSCKNGVEAACEGYRELDK